MRDMTKIATIDLQFRTQEAFPGRERASVNFQKMLSMNAIENIVLRVSHRIQHDVGSLCFLGTKSIRIPKNVDVSLHRPERAVPIRNLVSEIITMACTDKTPVGAYSKLADFSSLVKHCDKNKLENFLDSPESYHTALMNFTNHLVQSDLKITTQARVQSVVIECGTYLFPRSNFNFHTGIERIISVIDKKAATTPPPPELIKRYVRVFSCLFEELSDFILNDSLFPHKIIIDGEPAVLTTEAFPFLTESMTKNRYIARNQTHFIDYTTGRCKLWNEVYENRPNTKLQIYKNFCTKSARQLNLGNTQRYCQYRRRLHKIAHDSFVALFAINSGENESTIMATPWDDTYDVKNGNHGTRIISIKNRGGTQRIEFTVPAAFLKTFEKFLALRKHILAGYKHDMLFIGFGYQKFNGFRPLDSNVLIHLCTQMRSMVDISFPTISYRKLRAYKNHWIVKNYNDDVSAALLQHSKKVQLKNHSSREERTTVDVVVGALNKIVKVFKDKEGNSTPSGFCNGATPEKSIDIPSGYEPDCKNSKGCIFCTEYRVTADVESIHKLYSMEYVIKKFLHTCESVDHFNSIHQPALLRIEKILQRTFEVSPELLPQGQIIRESVYDRHELTDYWERYLSRLIRIGALR